jgi:predicted nucleotidyltransferase component of viral defense system
MIPRSAITEWRHHVAWATDAQVEQDLIISRAIVDLFSDDFLRENLAFRGGTALNKLFFSPPSRYSEDIDLVQTSPGRIGPIIDAVRERLSWFPDPPARDRAENMMHIVFSFDSEIAPVEPMKLKIEIHTREHNSVLPRIERPFHVKARWFTGEAQVTTFALEELLATKMRALYQRRKSRDLYDFSVAFNHAAVKDELVVNCFNQYMRAEGHPVTRAQYEQNLAAKIRDAEFRNDLWPLLASGVTYDPDAAYEQVLARLIARLDGEPWRGARDAP